MTIKFVRDHVVDGPPREEFKRGQVVEGRSDASELHFVRRGQAVFLDKKSGAMFDHDGKPVTDAAADKAAADKAAADKAAADKAAADKAAADKAAADKAAADKAAADKAAADKAAADKAAADKAAADKAGSAKK